MIGNTASSASTWEVRFTEWRVLVEHRLRKATRVERVAAGCVVLLVCLLLVATMLSHHTDDLLDDDHGEISNAVRSLSTSSTPAAPVTKEQLIMNLRIELPIITVVPQTKMANLREFVGSAHRFCPRCSLIVYSYDLTSEQLSEIAKWEHVHLYDVHRDLLPMASYDQSFNAIQYAIVHALQERVRGIYVSVDYAFTGTLEKVDSTLHDKGHLFITSTDMLTPGPRQDLVSTHIQGFVRLSNAFSDVALALVKNPCQYGPNSPCLWSNVIRLPTRGASRYVRTSISDLPVRRQNLPDEFIKMRLHSEANSNVDNHDIAYSTKPYHEELETFENTHFSYIRFDLSEITGDVKRAFVALHVVWTHNPAMPDATKTGAMAAMSLVTDNHWEERSLDWRSRPAIGQEIHSFNAETGDTIKIDVTGLVQEASKKPHGSKKISFALRSRNFWVKFHSRHAKQKQMQPELTVLVSGQGLNYRYIHSAYTRSREAPHSEVPIVEAFQSRETLE